MSTSLAAIRAKLLEQNERSSGNTTRATGENPIFAHWNLTDGSSATVRFLPDADPNNTFFWAERQQINLSFPGVKGGDERKEVTIKVPCMEMYGETCPVHAEIRPWFKDPSLEDTARKYWKKRSYIFQGFVVNPGDVEEEAPANPIRRFVISPQIFKVISSALMDPDFPELPTDYEGGTDFKINKTANGQYSNYTTSSWARRERALDDEERAAIETYGLGTLADFLPEKPNADAVNAIMEMFEASVNGELYDVERWGHYYRPYGVDAPTGSAPKATPAPKAAPAPVAEAAPAPVAEAVEDTPPFDADPVPAEGGAKPSAADILAAIRNRKEG